MGRRKTGHCLSTDRAVGWYSVGPVREKRQEQLVILAETEQKKGWSHTYLPRDDVHRGHPNNLRKGQLKGKRTPRGGEGMRGGSFKKKYASSDTVGPGVHYGGEL